MSPRLSGFELLRIMSIGGIILHHLFINDIDACGYNRSFCAITDGMFPVFANSFIVGG